MFKNNVETELADLSDKNSQKTKNKMEIIKKNFKIKELGFVNNNVTLPKIK